MMLLELSPRAALDLEEIADYIASDNPERAGSFVRELENHCRRIALAPLTFPLREDIAGGVRIVVHGRYLILFRVREKASLETVRIERIVHGARRLGDLI